MSNLKVGKHFLLFGVLSIISLCMIITISVSNAVASIDKQEYVPGQAIICMKPSGDKLGNGYQNNTDTNYSVIESLGYLTTSSNFQKTLSTNPLTMNDSLSKNIITKNSPESCEILLVSCDDTEKFIQATKSSEQIMWAQPNYVYSIDDEDLNDTCEEIITDDNTQNGNTNFLEKVRTENIDSSNLMQEVNSADDINNASYKYNDEYYKYQWGFDHNEFGVSSDIEAEKAWANGAGNPSLDDVIVAVMDSGVDYTHKDLKNVIWSDGDKYPSLVETFGSGAHGINTAPGEDTSDPMDTDNGHGSHCAGAIAAEADNAYGTVGVNSKNVKIMACRWMKDGKGQTSQALKAYNYVIAAKKAGVNVCCASNSWGSAISSSGYDYALENVLIEAGKVGIVSCFAAGNSTLDLDGCPNLLVDNPYVIFVGASNDNGNAAAFSNYGKHTVDVFSPGVNMLNTVNVSQTSSLKQYLPRIQPETDNWFYENFNTETPKIKLLTHKYNDLDNTYDDAFVDLNKGQIKIPLNHYEVGDKICAQVNIDKTYLQDLLASEQNPYISFLYGTTKNSLDGKLVCDLLYVDKSAKNPEPKLAPLPYKLYNSYMNVISAKATSTNYLNTDSDYVSIELSFDVTNNDNDSYLFIDDFGLGKMYSEFYFMSGTSMACPICSGIISEVCSRLQPQTAQDVIDVLACVKGGINHCYSPSEVIDKCITQGITSLNNSYEAAKVFSGQSSNLENISPVLQNLKTNLDGTYTVDGYFFSENEGSLYIDGAPVTITNWTNSQITFNPKNSLNRNEKYLAEFKVVRNDGNFNREFFEIESSAESGYIDIGMSNIEYTKSDGTTFTTNDLNPELSTATDNNFYGLFSDAQDTIIMEKYNFVTKEWVSIDLSSLNMVPGLLKRQCQLTAGYNEVYMLYLKKTEEGNKTHLVTFSEKENRFINDVNIDENAQIGDVLGFYNGELMLIRADALSTVFPEIQKRKTDIVKIYADTGTIFEEVGNYADFFEGDKNPYIAGGRVSSYGGKMYITDSVMTATPELLEMFGYKLDDIYNGVITFDGKTFKRGDYLNNNYDLIDEGQTNNNASWGISNGALTVGMVKNNGEANMIDTYNYSENANGQWNPIPNKFDSFKTASITAACNDNKFYVVGHRGLENKCCFKYLDLKSLNLASENPTVNAKKEYNEPITTPDPKILSNKNIASNTTYNSATTGDNLNMIIYALIFLTIISTTVISRNILKNKK